MYSKMLTPRTPFVLFAVLCVSISGCQTTALTPTTPSHIEIVDLATEFLNTACTKNSETEFVAAWKGYEEKHWPLFSTIFYNDERLQKERLTELDAMKGRKTEMCKHTRSFLFVAPDLIRKSARSVSSLMGEEPKASVYFVSAVQWTDGRGDDFNGKEIYVLNSRHDTYARTTGLVATITHELIHSAQSAKYPEQENLPPIVRSLYREGAAVYGVSLLFPEIGDGVTGLKENELQSAKQFVKQGAKELLSAWSNPVRDDTLLRRYFWGSSDDVRTPKKMGYYLGLEVFRQLGQTDKNVVQISPQAFQVNAKKILEGLAR